MKALLSHATSFFLASFLVGSPGMLRHPTPARTLAKAAPDMQQLECASEKALFDLAIDLLITRQRWGTVNLEDIGL